MLTLPAALPLGAAGFLSGASMTLSLRRACALVVLSALALGPAHANPQLDVLFDQARERWNLPGLAVGVVEDGEVVYMRSEGELRAGEGQSINDDTLFKIASNGKA